jgi:hypothetical protein
VRALPSLDRIEELLASARWLLASQWHELGDVGALISHPLDAPHDVQQRRVDPQVTRERRLEGQQRQQALVHLDVACVDPGIVSDDDLGELDVMVAERLKRAVDLSHGEIEAPERLALVTEPGGESRALALNLTASSSMEFSRADVLPVGPPVIHASASVATRASHCSWTSSQSASTSSSLGRGVSIGKTTVALAALERLAEAGALVCAIDCRQIATAASLCLELDAQRLAHASQLRQQARHAGSWALRLWQSIMAAEEHPDSDVRLAEAVTEALTGTRSSATVADALLALSARPERRARLRSSTRHPN